MNPVLLRYAGVALLAAIFGAGGATLIVNNKTEVNQAKVVISDIITQPRLGWAVIYWSTDVQTTAIVDYGKTGSYGLVVQEGYGDGSVKHRAYLTGIGEGTYHFRITTTDPKAGKTIVTPDQTVIVYPVQSGCKDVVHVPEDYRHIQAALDATCRGGTVYVGPGEYREDIVSGANLIGAGASKTIIRGPGVGYDGWGSTVHLVSVAIDSNRDGNIDQFINPTLSGFTITSDYVQETGIIDNAYAQSGSVGVTVNSGPAEKLTTIKNNVFKHLDMGVMLIQYNEPAAIVNNTFVGGKGQDYGVLMAFGGGTPSPYETNLIENNAIVDYQKAGVWIMCPGICDFLRPTDFIVQYNNTWRNTRDYLFTENLPSRVWPVVHSPVLWQNYLGIPIPAAKTKYDPTGKNGNISLDPMFVNKAAGDYHELAGSPHIDKGNPKSDFSLEPQPNGGRVNIGAYGNTTEATISR